MRALLVVAAAALAACAAAPAKDATGARVLTGLDVLVADGFRPLKGKRVGVITNHTGVDARGRSIVELLGTEPGVTLAVVFSPEHGFAGAAANGSAVASGKTVVAGREVPVVSLYRGGVSGMKPLPADLRGLDALVFDIQDIGARFYNYPTTMAMALEAAKDAGVEFFVLDRPVPVGGAVVEGAVPDIAGLLGSTSLAYLPVATRHGMTVGELARLHNAEVKHPKLRVIALRGWTRPMWFDATGLPWIAPSPNMPDLDSAALYPGTAQFEETNLSVGRGTPAPFRWLGAPWLDAVALARVMNAARLPGVSFQAQTFTPTKDKYAGVAVPGVLIAVTDRAAVRPLKVFARLIAAIRDRHSADFVLDWKESRRMIGTAAFKPWFDAGEPAAALEKIFDDGAAAFAAARKPYLLYGDE